MADHTRHGKWSQPEVPHRGWYCVDVEDLGEPNMLCQMCESVEIRYVHFMEHPNYKGTIGVGCVCAENMEEDYIGPRLRERKVQAQSRRRKTWTNKKWRISAKGNFYLNADGFNVTVFKKIPSRRDTWAMSITHRSSGRRQLGIRTYVSEGDAKRAAFNAVAWAKLHLAGSS